MKTKVCFIFFLLIVTINFGQTVNLNPDPNGSPWIAGPQPELTPEILATLTEHHMSDAALAVMIPPSCDNSNLSPVNFFPDIIEQEYNSCAQAAGVEYTFAYEINRNRNEPSNNLDNNYHQMFTYNFLNWGLNVGTYTFDGWNIIRDNGIPSKSHYLTNPDTNDWHTGYDDYYQGTTNRIVSHAYINVSSIAKLEELKTWVYNHDDPSNPTEKGGGLGVFDLMTNFNIEQMTVGAVGERGIIETGTGNDNFSHALTIVGYNDAVGYDFDGNGTVNNIGALANWELGAFKVANSWGIDWPQGNNGFIWVPYRFFDGKTVRIITEVESREPEMVAKIKFYHECRSALSIGVFITDQPNASPTQWNDYDVLEPFGKLKCGCVEVLGNGTSNPIEIAFDLTDYIEQYNGQAFPWLKFILGMQESDDNGLYEGEIVNFSIIDYRGDEPFEVYHHESMPKPLVNDGITNVSLHYFVLPDLIDSIQTFTFPTIVRDQVVVQANASLGISSLFFDFYDEGNLEIQDYALLNFTGNTNVVAMRGTENQITLKGELSLGNNIVFSRRNSFPQQPHLSLMFDNTGRNYSFGSFDFIGSILGQSSSLALHNVDFYDTDIDYKYGDFSLIDSELELSSLTVSEPAPLNKTINISGNSFNDSQLNQPIITIEDYSTYNINNNIIENGNEDGILLSNAGDIEGNKNVSFNTITNNGISSPNSAGGIVVYNSHADIHYNLDISGNPYGIKSLNNSKTSLRGNKLAHSPSETQHIYDNDYNQIFSMASAVPYYCHWNAIESSNPAHPELFYYETPPNCIGISDVRWNYWGSSFDPLSDLVEGCIWDPVWNNFNSITDTLADADELLYNMATEQVNCGDYSTAQQTLKQLILSYPDSLFAEVAIKDLYVMEDQAGNNFDSLIIYFESDSIIQNTYTLKRIANYLINFCELKQENYQAAIDGFSDVILNPETYQDSVCAIIDLAYAYQVMQNSSGRDIYLGNLPQYFYHSKEQYRSSRQFHLSLIKMGKSQNNVNDDSENQENGKFTNQSYPNPAINLAYFDFILQEDGGIEIELYDQLGRQFLSSGNRNYTKGDQQLIMNISSLPSGIYFYTLKVNGRICDAGKMIKATP